MPSPAALASEQRAAQAGLITVMLRDLAKIWHLISVGSLNRSLPTWITAVNAVINRYAPMAATLAADTYDSARLAAKAPGTFMPTLADPPNDRHVDELMRWATKSLWSRDTETLPERVRVAQNQAESTAARLVEDVGRLTITYAVRDDPAAMGWVRTAAPGACAFCRMLATRGPTYSANTVKFRAHNDCHCMAVPLFQGQKWEPSAQVREWQKQYHEAAKAPGDTLKNLRRIVGR